MPTPRQLALTAIGQILLRGAKPKASLEALAVRLDRRDRTFLMEMVYGVVRYRDALDWILRRLLHKPRLPGSFTLNNLRAGLYQIFFMRVPGWASVNEAVNIEQRNKGLVNAVLRNALRRHEEIEKEMKALEDGIGGPSSVKNISILTSHPEWMVKRYVRSFGHEEAYQLAKANNSVPPLSLRINTLRATREDVLRRLEELGMEARPSSLNSDGIVLEGVRSFRELEALRGLVVAQDEAAQLIAPMLGPRPGERVLDACAAPGGKTTHLAQLMNDQGEVVAVDIEEERIRLLEENVSLLGLKSIKAVIADLNAMDESRNASFDRVLLDAPCSATGTIRRNPDVKYRHGKGDLAKFRSRQGELLRSAARMLRPGGTLVYCTCSLEPEEGEEVLAGFLKEYPDFHIIRDVPLPAEVLAEGVLRTYPHRHGTDGFFGVKIGKARGHVTG